MIRVLLAEDHLMVRAGLQALLERAQDINVIGQASNGQEAIDLTVTLKPDVLVLDIMMPRLNGIQAAEQIRTMKLPVKSYLSQCIQMQAWFGKHYKLAQKDMY
ncbi:MAG: response regulator transcription factor [Anaerolineales bacterium]|nr:response regulator transcription factor [Anaerolineales bacterium]